MIIPIRCFTCNQIIANKWTKYQEKIQEEYLKNNVEYVTIIGGGDLMTLREVMKYKTIKKVFMLELNQEIVTLCKEYFDQHLQGNNLQA